MTETTILLADKRLLFREGLAKLLADYPGLRVLGTCSSGNECIQRVEELKPDVVLLDTELEDCDYMQVVWKIGELQFQTRIIILTHSEEKHDLLNALRIGAKAYLSKNITLEQLLGAIHSVQQGDVVVSSPMASKMLEEFDQSKHLVNSKASEFSFKLSPQELKVLSLVAKGYTNREIAEALFISDNTVRSHLHRIMQKLEVSNRQRAMVFAIEKGILSRDTWAQH